MRRNLIIIFLFFCLWGYSQDSLLSAQRLFSLGLSSGIGAYTGNNFIAKTYNSINPIRFDLQFNVQHFNLGVGLYYKYNQGYLKTTEYVGNSTKGNFNNGGVYLCYYWNIKQKWLINPKAGVGIFGMKNTLAADNSSGSTDLSFKTNGTVYCFSSDLHYFLTTRVSVFTNLAYNYISLNGINGSGANGTNYHSSNEFDVLLGLKVWVRE